MAGWGSHYELLREEFVQRADEGCAIPASLRADHAALDPVADAENRAALDPIYDALMALPVDAKLAADEPNDLNAIRALRPEGPRDLGWEPGAPELLDKLHGAWTGRCVGCALGKPVEAMGMQRDDDGALVGRRRIREYLEARGDWPLRDYFSNRAVAEERKLPQHFLSFRETIEYMEPDDDIHYALVGLGVLEEKGRDFAWDDVARYWLYHIPVAAMCTAERQAVINFQNASGLWYKPTCGPEWTSTHRNPYREWIGAQIRADGFAYCCAGNPELAAEFAWRDAHWTHRRNGIYGEMMFAAIQAAAFVEPDPVTLVHIGLSEIPRNCRLAVWVQRCLEWCETYPDFESCMVRLEYELGGMNTVHTINNALVCVIAMVYGGMDTTLTPAIAVMCGLDTDCNGATVGSMVGAIHGRKAFGGTMANRLNDTLKPSVIGFEVSQLKDLAARTARVRESLLSEEG